MINDINNMFREQFSLIIKHLLSRVLIKHKENVRKLFGITAIFHLCYRLNLNLKQHFRKILVSY